MNLFSAMSKSGEVLETLTFINHLERCPTQINAPFESDAEIVKLPSGQHLVTTTDTLCEEFSLGLIRNPKTMGWLMLTASASDLAALGVHPLGFLISVASPPDATREILGDIAIGAQEACTAYRSFIWGGDTSSASEWVLSATAIAVEPECPKISRLGQDNCLKPGESVYLTGPIGWGNAVGLTNFIAQSDDMRWRAQQLDALYRPRARLAEGELIARFGSSCMDTSDGLMMTLDFLTLASRCGIEFDFMARLFHSLALDVAAQTQVSPFFFAAAQNGEFELLFTVSPDAEKELVAALKAIDCMAIRMGRVVEKTGLFMSEPSGSRSLDLAPIRNLLHDKTPPQRYIDEMLRFAKDEGFSSCISKF